MYDEIVSTVWTVDVVEVCYAGTASTVELLFKFYKVRINSRLLLLNIIVMMAFFFCAVWRSNKD